MGNHSTALTRFSAHLVRFQGDPCWLCTVENLYRQRLADWLAAHELDYTQDADSFTVEDRAWTVLALWRPVPELDLVVE